MTVELHSAFVWDCGECGTENFERAIEGSLDEAAMQENANQIDTHLIGTDEGDVDDEDLRGCEALTQRIVLAPARVKCRNCGHTYPTKVWHIGED